VQDVRFRAEEADTKEGYESVIWLDFYSVRMPTDEMMFSVIQQIAGWIKADKERDRDKGKKMEV